MITEGLHEDDLDGVLIPVVSIDEYHGKIEDESLVVSFFLSDPHAAADLSSYIESGPYAIMDSDVSKSINEDGYYQVFIEMERIAHFFYDLQDIINDLTSLVGNQKWQFMSPSTKGEAYPLTKQNVKKYVNYMPESQKTSKPESKMDEAIFEFLSTSDASNIVIQNNHIMFEGSQKTSTNAMVTFSDTSLLYHILDLNTKPINESVEYKKRVKDISSILGPCFAVESAGNFIVIYDENRTSKALLLK